MNTLLKFFYLLISFLLTILTNACVTTDDFAVPEPEPTIVTMIGTKVTIGALKNQFDFQSEEIITYSGTNTYIEGYVISSDEAGNFFKELVIQDLPSNPTAGIQIIIDKRSLYQKYDLGRKVYVQLDGLSLGLANGVLKLGKLQEKSIEAISEFEVENHVFRTPEVKKIVPRKLTIKELNSNVESLYVTFSNMQFAKELLEDPSKTLAGTATDRFQGERELQSCATQESIILSTSVYADFKSLSLPPAKGSVSGILSKDFFGKYYVLRINSSRDLMFHQSTRCDLEYLSCGINVLQPRTTVLFEEDFEKITKDKQLDELGWINVNSHGDDKRWGNKKIRNVANRVMTISAFNSGLNPLEAWLITPAIDMDQTTDEVLSFEVQTSFNNGKALTIWVTNNFTGDPETTKWVPLDIAIPQKNTNNVKVSPFSISCLGGKIRIAFRYKGRDPGSTSTYNLDNIKIYGASK